MILLEDAAFRSRARVTQIIAGALLAGLLSFVAIAVFVVSSDRAPPPQDAFGDLPIISLVACGVFAINLTLWGVLPATIARISVRQMAARTAGSQAPDTSSWELLSVWQSTRIVALALLEGAGFFGAVAYLVEKHWLGLAVALAAATVMVLTFPTEGRAQAWVESQEGALDELRLQDSHENVD